MLHSTLYFDTFSEDKEFTIKQLDEETIHRFHWKVPKHIIFPIIIGKVIIIIIQNKEKFQILLITFRRNVPKIDFTLPWIVSE